VDTPTPPEWVEGPLIEEWKIGVNCAIRDHGTSHVADFSGNPARSLAYRKWREYLEVKHGQGEEG